MHRRHAGLDLERLAERGHRFAEPALIFERVTQVVVCFGEVGVERQGLPIGGDRIAQPALGLECVAQVVVRPGDIGIQRHQLAQDRHRLSRLSLRAERVAQIVQRLGIIGLQFQCRAVFGHRIVQLALVFERIAQVVPRPGKVGLERQGAAVGRHRCLEFALRFERHAHVVVRLGIVGPQGNRLADQLGRPARVAPSDMDYAIVAQRDNMLGVAGQDVDIDRLGFRQSPGLEVRHRLAKPGIRGPRSARRRRATSPDLGDGAPSLSVHAIPSRPPVPCTSTVMIPISIEARYARFGTAPRPAQLALVRTPG